MMTKKGRLTLKMIQEAHKKLKSKDILKNRKYINPCEICEKNSPKSEGI